MVASFEYNLASGQNKRTDLLQQRRIDSRVATAEMERSERPFTSHQNLWYRSDGYFANAVAAKQAQRLEASRREWSSSAKPPLSPRPQSAQPRSRMTSDSVFTSLDPNNNDLSSMPWASPLVQRGSTSRPQTARASAARRGGGSGQAQRLFASTGEKPERMVQCWTNAVYSPRWQPKHWDAEKLLPPGSRPKRYAESLISLTSRAIDDEERSTWSPRSVPSRNHPIYKPPDL